MRSLILLLVIPIALGAQGRAGRGAPNSPNGTPMPPPPPTPAADLATVEGQVNDASTGEPLRKASITMNLVRNTPGAAPVQSNYSATTDATGKFTIQRLEPGQYRVNANHTGYLNMQYNARRPDGPGTVLELGRAQKMTGVNFRLTPHGVIAGHMLDEDGDPLQGVQVQLMRAVYNRGRKTLQQFNGNNTNDLGEYRIAGIQPGKYYMCATYRGRGMFIDVMNMNLDVNGQRPQQEDYTTTCYPGVTDITAASPLDMKPGQQLQGINLKLTKIHTVGVRGTVTNNTAPPPPPPDPNLPGRGGIRVNVNVQLEPRNSLGSNGMMQQGTNVRPDGSFEFQSVAPGSYTLIAMSNGNGGPNGNSRHAVSVPIDVGSAGLDGVNIAINPGVSVAGHIRIDGETTDQIPNFQVRLNPWSNNFFGQVPQPSKVDAQNNFHLDDINPEHYEVVVNPMPGTFYIKSIRNGNTEVLTSGLDLTQGGGANLDVIIGTNAPTISGVVQNPSTQQPAIAVTVVLIPQEKERRETSLFYRQSNSDQNGAFTIGRVPPGEYRIYAFEDVESGSWYDADFMKPIESKGTPVSVKEGNPVTIQVTMIPAGSGN
jgi:Carboxypeptidase regulatory-like domain